MALHALPSYNPSYPMNDVPVIGDMTTDPGLLQVPDHMWPQQQQQQQQQQQPLNYDMYSVYQHPYPYPLHIPLPMPVSGPIQLPSLVQPPPLPMLPQQPADKMEPIYKPQDMQQLDHMLNTLKETTNKTREHANDGDETETEGEEEEDVDEGDENENEEKEQQKAKKHKSSSSSSSSSFENELSSSKYLKSKSIHPKLSKSKTPKRRGRPPSKGIAGTKKQKTGIRSSKKKQEIDATTLVLTNPMHELTKIMADMVSAIAMYPDVENSELLKYHLPAGTDISKEGMQRSNRDPVLAHIFYTSIKEHSERLMLKTMRHVGRGFSAFCSKYRHRNVNNRRKHLKSDIQEIPKSVAQEQHITEDKQEQQAQEQAAAIRSQNRRKRPRTPSPASSSTSSSQRKSQ